MIGWQKDKMWSDKFIPEIKQILGTYLIGEPPMEEDQKRNTDLMVLKMEAVRIGCRIRTSSYMANYGDEFTIRSDRPSGEKTELAKIMEGWGDYFFYGFGKDNDSLLKWTLADLDVFRTWFNSEKNTGIKKDNLDGSSSFVAFKWLDLPADFIIGKSKEKPRYSSWWDLV